MDYDQQDAWDLDTDEIRSIDSDELHDTRPNRWRGPATSWRELTEEERLLHNSLEQTRNQNLSVHLYNAFALKRPSKSTREEPSASEAVPPASQPTLEDLVSPGDWRPPARWTSWPLHVSRVPNEDLVRETHDDYDDFTTKWKGREVPSQKLEEEVTASILRSAKERFRLRNFEPVEDVDETESEDASQPGDDSSNEEARAAVKREPIQPYEHKDEAEEAPVESVAPDTDGAGTPAVEERGCVPVVLADDDLAHDILRPSIRHILSQLDATLRTLHHTRVAGLATFDQQSESEDEGSSVASGAPGKRRRSRKGKGRSRAASTSGDSSDAGDPREKYANDEYVGSMEDVETEAERRGDSRQDTPRSRSRPVKDRSRRSDKGERVGRWGLRDWRDILGAAAISGFDKDAVERAGQRCADLFGQSMEFKTMEEGKGRHTTTLCKPGGQVQGIEDPDGSDDETRHIEEERRRLRFKAAIHRRQRENRALNSHDRSAAVSDDDGFKTADETQGSDEDESNDKAEHQPLGMIDINKVEASPDGLFRCPVPYCKRHEKGFSAKRGLREHYRLTHGQPTAERGTFYCPFAQCKYHTRSFKTKKNLRAHIKNMHPQQTPSAPDAMDVDNDEVAEPAPVVVVLDSEDEMDGGVHVDGFLKPIKIRQGWLTKGGRQKGSKGRETTTRRRPKKQRDD